MEKNKKIHSDQKYIDGLLKNDEAIVDRIYKKMSPKIKHWVTNNSGSIADAGDIFQEALIAVFRQAKEKNLELTCPFEAYLLAIVKRMWYKELKKRKRKGVTIDIDEVYNVGTSNIQEMEEALDQQEKENEIMQFFDTLGESCRKIIRLCLKKEHPQEEIAEQLGISYAYLRKKKSECMAKLIQKVETSGLKI